MMHLKFYCHSLLDSIRSIISWFSSAKGWSFTKEMTNASLWSNHIPTYFFILSPSISTAVLFEIAPMQESIRQLACQIDVGLYPAEVKVIPTKVNVLSKLEKNAVCREKNFKKNLKFNLEEPREMKKKNFQFWYLLIAELDLPLSEASKKARWVN